MAGLRQRGKKGTFVEAGEDWETASNFSVNSNEDQEDPTAPTEIPLTIEQQFDENVDRLSEKRFSIREHALEFINKTLSSQFQKDLAESRHEAIVTNLSRSLKIASQNEGIIACRTFGLLALTLGVDDEYYSSVMPILNDIINDTTKHHTFRAAALDTAAVVTLASASDLTLSTECMSLLGDHFKSGFADLREAAYRGWGVLASSLENQYVSQTLVPTYLLDLVEALSDSEAQVRVAIGETIATLVNGYRIHTEDQNEDFDIYNLGDIVAVDDLLDQVGHLSSNLAGKKDREKQRGVFRDISKVLTDGGVSDEVLFVNSQEVRFNTWPQLVQLAAIRAVLLTGLPVHIADNPLMEDILGVHVRSKDNFQKVKLSALEKRKFKSPNSAVSKKRDQSRNKARRQASSSYEQDDD